MPSKGTLLPPSQQRGEPGVFQLPQGFPHWDSTGAVGSAQGLFIACQVMQGQRLSHSCYKYLLSIGAGIVLCAQWGSMQTVLCPLESCCPPGDRKNKEINTIITNCNQCNEGKQLPTQRVTKKSLRSRVVRTHCSEENI